MKRLRHPIRAIEEPFGKAGLIVACIALVFAMIGGAYAAGKLTSKQKKEVEKIAKKFAGKPGAPGANGAPGTNGTNGKDGTNGTNGSPGAPGAPGESVTNTAIPTSSATCEHRGGAEFKVGAGVSTTACNGEPGVLHPGETLAPGATETGSWAFGPTNENLAPELVPGLHLLVVPVATFAIPLAAPLEAAQTHYVTTKEQEEETAPEECSGSAETPTAEPGNLCIYGGFEEEARVTPLSTVDPSKGLTPGAASAGAAQIFKITSTNNTFAEGTWAVTEAE